MEKISCIVILEHNINSIEIIKSYIGETNYEGCIEVFTEYDKGFEFIKNNQCAVLADISNLSDNDIKVVESIKDYTSQIIFTTTDCTTNTIIKSLRAGAKEVIPKPVLKEDLLHAFKSISQEDNNVYSKIIAIYSNKGGIGKTTVAVNLSSELARVTNEKVALVDLNLQLGDVSTFLNLTPAFDVGYVTGKLINNNDVPVEKFFEQYKNTSLYILSDPNYIEQSESITPQLIQKLFNKLKKSFSYIVIDLSSNIDANTLQALDLSDMIIFNTIVNVPSLRNAQRCLNLFRSRKYSKNKIKILINRYMENDEISVNDIENTLNEKVYWKIPNNYFTIMEAINKGTSVWEVNPNSNIGGSFRELASKIYDETINESLIQYKN